MGNNSELEYVDKAEDASILETFVDASKEDVLRLIEEVVISYLECLQQEKEPSLSVISRTRKNAVYCKSEQYIRLKLGVKRIRMTNGRRFQGLWKVLQTCYELLKEGKSVNQRELYYMNTNIFTKQRECDDCIQDCCALLRVPRDALGITATAKGYITGNILLLAKESGTWLDLSVENPVSISYDMITSLSIRSNAKCIIVVEKEGIFKRLFEDRFFDAFPCVLITGRGFPDLATRAFTHFVSTQLHLPILGLCDWNPYGMALLLTYILGSYQSGLETYRYCVSLKWIGLHFEDIQTLHLPHSVQQPFTKMDEQKCKTLSEHPFIQENPTFLQELDQMKTNRFKVELESIYFRGIEYFSREYLLQKVQQSLSP